jgi:hypothetical protein
MRPVPAAASCSARLDDAVSSRVALERQAAQPATVLRPSLGFVGRQTPRQLDQQSAILQVEAARQLRQAPWLFDLLDAC